MTGPAFADIQAETTDERLAGLPPVRFVVLRNITLEPIEPYLRYFGAEAGFRAVVQFGGYDTAFQEAAGGRPELFGSPVDYVLVCLKLENLSWSLARGFAGLSPADVAAELDRVRGQIAAIAAGIRRQTAAPIFWFGFENPLYPALALADEQDAAIGALNQFVRDALGNAGNARFVDANRILARLGGDRFYDLRYWHIGRAPYTRQALREFASEIFKYVRAQRGRTRKCLVLDCDNVLWGGIVGEDGVSGVKLGAAYPGSAFREFQQEALDLYHRGVILALCSKNNEQDVWEVFDRHPGMLLRREHIAAARINWLDKASNLREISAELNIGVDALVYADDSDFEVNLVKQMIPDIAVLHLPKDKAVENRDRLAAGGWFDWPERSAEDARRGALYAAEAQRREVRATATDLESYYRSLRMILEIRFANEDSIPRIAQLTQKTNQFNLTTCRYTDADIRRFAESGAADVISLRLVDRFGDAGIVGVAIVTRQARAATVDTLLLSCRVLGRRVEDALLSECVRLAAARDCDVLVGVYRPTAKNAQVREFYPRRGFEPGEREGEFVLDVRAWRPPDLSVFERIESEAVALEVR